MRQKTSHTGDPATSSRLKLAVEILKDADAPMTVMELQLESQRRGGYLANPGTCIYEIGQADGYCVSDGLEYGQKAGPAVRFPDGKYRYWLVSAPGWRQSWTVDREYRVVPVGVKGEGRKEEASSLFPPPSSLTVPRTCLSCGEPVPDGPPFCGKKECRNVFFWQRQRPGAGGGDADAEKLNTERIKK